MANKKISNFDFDNKITIGEFLRDINFKAPDGTLIYNPNSYCSFSGTGELLVTLLINVAPNFHLIFNKIMPLEEQKTLMYECFFIEKDKWVIEQQSQGEILAKEIQDSGSIDNSEKAKGKSYFETNRKFEYLVPPCYQRSSAPRLTALGSTLHGMKGECA